MTLDLNSLRQSVIPVSVVAALTVTVPLSACKPQEPRDSAQRSGQFDPSTAVLAPDQPASRAAAPADVIDPSKVVTVGADGLTDSQRSSMQDTIAQCVQHVRSSAPQGWRREYWMSFDAYYNPNTAGVVSNAVVRGRIDAAFAFDKCMADHGYYPKPN
jgi:hypothetical protein